MHILETDGPKRRVTLKWNDNSRTEDGFLLERRETMGRDWTRLASLGPNVTEFTDETAQPGHVYQYRVCAWNAAGASAWCYGKTPARIPASVADRDCAAETVTAGAVSVG